MYQIIRALVMVQVYLYSFLVFGILSVKRGDAKTLSSYIVRGMVAYYVLFGVISLPMKVTLQKLSTLSIIWGIIVLLAYIIVIILYRETLSEIFKVNAS